MFLAAAVACAFLLYPSMKLNLRKQPMKTATNPPQVDHKDDDSSQKNLAKELLLHL